MRWLDDCTRGGSNPAGLTVPAGGPARCAVFLSPQGARVKNICHRFPMRPSVEPMKLAAPGPSTPRRQERQSGSVRRPELPTRGQPSFMPTLSRGTSRRPASFARPAPLPKHGHSSSPVASSPLACRTEGALHPGPDKTFVACRGSECVQPKTSTLPADPGSPCADGHRSATSANRPRTP